MNEKTIDLNNLHQYCDLSPGWCGLLVEAICICLEKMGHEPGVRLHVKGDFERTFLLTWKRPAQEISKSWRFQNMLVEMAAYALAIICVYELTPFRVVEQAGGGTGFDYLLERKPDASSNEKEKRARVEVSGILQGSVGQINFRVKVKTAQPKPVFNMPTIIVVAEFSRPLVKMKKR